MTQIDFFAKTQTDNLLRLRYRETCYYPENECDTPAYSQGGILSWYINKALLYAELEKRPHRIRAKDRRKKSKSTV